MTNYHFLYISTFSVFLQRQYIEDIVEYYGNKNERKRGDNLRRLRNVPLQLDSDRKRIRKEKLKKSRSRRISKKDKECLDLFRIDSKDIRFKDFEPINELWKK